MPRPRILLIDDNHAFTTAFGELAAERGYDVALAESGAEGLAVLADKEIDLVLLDIIMPGIDGFEVLAEIRKREIPTRVIMLTGGDFDLRSIIKLIKSGACDYVQKGSSDEVEMLFSAMERALILDTTINVNIANATPLINKLSQEAENLRSKLVRLSQEMETAEARQVALRVQLNNKDVWSNVRIRLLYLMAATCVTVAFYFLRIVTTTQSLFVLPLLIFVLMLFPIERIRSFSAKHKELEARVEVGSESQDRGRITS